jgi:hypothetical protein
LRIVAYKEKLIPPMGNLADAPTLYHHVILAVTTTVSGDT